VIREARRALYTKRDRSGMNRIFDTASASDLRPGLRHQLLLAVWWCVGFYALNGCSSREFVEQSYVGVDDVARQNAFSPAGKVPVRLPPSSIDIRIRSSVQTDDVWAVFSWVCSRFPMGRGVAIIGTELRILRQSSEVSVCAGLDPLERSGRGERRRKTSGEAAGWHRVVSRPWVDVLGHSGYPEVNFADLTRILPSRETGLCATVWNPAHDIGCRQVVRHGSDVLRTS